MKGGRGVKLPIGTGLCEDGQGPGAGRALPYMSVFCQKRSRIKRIRTNRMAGPVAHTRRTVLGGPDR